MESNGDIQIYRSAHMIENTMWKELLHLGWHYSTAKCLICYRSHSILIRNRISLYYRHSLFKEPRMYIYLRNNYSLEELFGLWKYSHNFRYVRFLTSLQLPVYLIPRSSKLFEWLFSVWIVIAIFLVGAAKNLKRTLFNSKAWPHHVPIL